MHVLQVSCRALRVVSAALKHSGGADNTSSSSTSHASAAQWDVDERSQVPLLESPPLQGQTKAGQVRPRQTMLSACLLPADAEPVSSFWTLPKKKCTDDEGSARCPSRQDFLALRLTRPALQRAVPDVLHVTVAPLAILCLQRCFAPALAFVQAAWPPPALDPLRIFAAMCDL